jgi:hypothetical protein
VHANCIDVGAVEQRLVGGGVVGLDPLDQLVLAQELRRRRRRLGRLGGFREAVRKRDGRQGRLGRG